MFQIAIVILAVLSTIASSSICDTYTEAIFKAGNNNKANQERLVLLLVNTAVAGNTDFSGGKLSETFLNADNALGKKGADRLNVTVTGILNLSKKGQYKDANVSLIQFFNGAGMTSNVNNYAAKVNFLDIGFAPFLSSTSYMYSSDEMMTKQYMLMLHLYQIFSALLGCSLGYPNYTGVASMWTKHRFMQLTDAQNMYFITQVGAAAQSYGVSSADVTTVATALIKTFNRKDADAVAIKPDAGLTKALQSCCQGATCEDSATPNAAAYATAAAAQIPPLQAICDRYTSAIFGEITQAKQEALILLLVNTAVAGNINFGMPVNNLNGSPLNADNAKGLKGADRLNVTVAGILNLSGKGQYEGVNVSLVQFFNGAGPTSNVNNAAGVVNFLDVGFAPFLTFPYTYTAEMMMTKQYMLMQHLYQIFSALLGCSAGYQSYTGVASMWTKHRFMQLTDAQNMYFITQVGAAAKSYGVTDTDINTVATALVATFNRKDAAAVAIKASAGLTTALQSCCQGATCTTAASPNSAAYMTAAAMQTPFPSAMPTMMSQSSAISYLSQPYAYLLATLVSGLLLL